MSSNDELSESGEIIPSPSEVKSNDELNESNEDDTLNIKPPQPSQASRVRKHESKDRHERHRRERRSHKHHSREKHSHLKHEGYLRSEEYEMQANHMDRHRHRDKTSSRHSDNQHSYEEVYMDEISYERRRHKRRQEHESKHRERRLHKERRHKRRHEEEVIDLENDKDEEDTSSALTEEEKAEQALRRARLLESEREMEKLKEQSRLERERRQRQDLKRKNEEDEFYMKRLRVEETSSPEKSASDVEEVEREDNKKSGDTENSSSSSTESDEEADKSERSSSSEKKTERSERRSESLKPSRNRSPSLSDKSDSGSTKSFENQNGNHKEEETEQEKEKKEEVVKPTIDESLPPYYPAIQGCRSVLEFQSLNRIEEGTYGVVYRAKDKRSDEIVALKRLKMEKEKEGFPITSLREINTLLKGQHPNIVTVREIVVGSNMDKIYIVMDYVEHDLKSLMEIMRHKKQKFLPGEIKCLLRQLLVAVAHLHDNWILHRDLKTSNLLLSHKGILKVGDFGLAREYDSPLKAYTPIVVTLWYRAPELLLGSKEYSTPIDMWSVGCIFAEFVLMNALFPGNSEIEQINKIFKELGTPTEKIWPGYSELPAVKKLKFTSYPKPNLRARFHALSEMGVNLLTKFLTYDPAQRITAEEALEHPYFTEHPLPIDPAMFPTWPAKSELGMKRALNECPKPPSGGGEFKKLGDDSYGFTLGMGVDVTRGVTGFNLKF